MSEVAEYWSFQDDKHTWFDDELRIAREYEPGGQVLIRERPFTEQENRETDYTIESAARRAEVERREEAVRALVDATEALATPPADGTAWVQPTGAHDAYAKGSTVTYNGKTWESLTPFNVWAPGVSGWREVAGVGLPAWVQPTGGHDAYAMGARVSHNGQDWENTGSPANVWEPGVFGWTVIP